MSVIMYELRNPMSQVSEEQTNAFLAPIAHYLGETMERKGLDEFLQSDFGLIYVASGGSEEPFRKIWDRMGDRPCYLLASSESNSLASSLEILSFLQQRGQHGEILHGDPEKVAQRIRTLATAAKAKAMLHGMRLGIIGTPSDWLIASRADESALMEKLGIKLIDIPMQELLETILEKPVLENKWTAQLRAMGYASTEMDKALTVYAAIRRLVERYQLGAVTVRCFDLLGSVKTTGCLALAILNAEGIYAGCESDVPSTVSMAILGAVSAEPVFMCNPNRIDAKSGHMVLAHCTLPLNMAFETTLTTHYESNIGVAIAGSIHEGICTIFKAAGDLSRYFAKAGRIQGNLREPTLCRSQIQVTLDDFSYFLRKPISNHHLVCQGDHTAALQEFFAML